MYTCQNATLLEITCRGSYLFLGFAFSTEDTIDMPEYQKEKIECADFCALDWKFHGVNVNPKMKTLLKEIS